VFELATLAQAVNDRRAHGEQCGDLAHSEKPRRFVQQKCSKTPSKPCQILIVRTVVGGCTSIVIARDCRAGTCIAKYIGRLHTAGVAGSNPAAPTKYTRNSSIRVVEAGPDPVSKNVLGCMTSTLTPAGAEEAMKRIRITTSKKSEPMHMDMPLAAAFT